MTIRKKESILLEIVYLSFILIIFNFLYYTSISLTINRESKLAVSHIKTCMDQNKKVSLVTALNECATNSLVGGDTGDVFIVRLRDMKILWDNSIDCKDGNKSMYLTKNSICKLAEDKESCITLANKIHKGYNGEEVWKFNVTDEYDTWIIMPNTNQNFDGSFRSIEGLKDQIAIVQGVQYNEFTKYLKILKYFINIFLGLYLAILVIIIVIKSNEEVMND